jgi:hypothetical protein
VPRALLVADQDVPDLAGVKQRVVGGEDRAAWNSENHVNTDPLKCHDQGLRTGDADRGRAGGLRPRRGRLAAAGLGRARLLALAGRRSPRGLNGRPGRRRLGGGRPRRDVQRGRSVRL